MVRYAAAQQTAEIIFSSEVQSHWGDWLKPGGEKSGTLPTFALVNGLM